MDVGSKLGGDVIVTVCHVCAEGTVGVAYHIGEDGTRTKVSDQRYDSSTGTTTMVLKHLSLYEIVDEEPSGLTDGLIILCICVGAVLLIVAAVIIARSLKKA